MLVDRPVLIILQPVDEHVTQNCNEKEEIHHSQLKVPIIRYTRPHPRTSGPASTPEKGTWPSLSSRVIDKNVGMFDKSGVIWCFVTVAVIGMCIRQGGTAPKIVV